MKNTATTIHHALRSAETMRKKLRDRRIALKAQIDMLERHGVLRGSLHQQEKRPGYVVWYFNQASIDCPGGKRKRVYLGNDKKKIDTAKKCIARGRERDKHAAELRAVDDAMRDFERMLRAAIESAEYRSRRW